MRANNILSTKAYCCQLEAQKFPVIFLRLLRRKAWHLLEQLVVPFFTLRCLFLVCELVAACNGILTIGIL